MLNWLNGFRSPTPAGCGSLMAVQLICWIPMQYGRTIRRSGRPLVVGYRLTVSAASAALGQ